MDVLKIGWYAIVVVVRVWQIEQSEKWDALVAHCKGRGGTEVPSWGPRSLRCKACLLADSLRWRYEDRRARRMVPIPSVTQRPCGCKDPE